MSKPAIGVALVFLLGPACAGSPPDTVTPSIVQGCTKAQEVPAGKATSALTLSPSIHNVTVSARDLDENREVTNTETYPVLDHGFALDLPFGHYDIELTDETNAMLARYLDVVVDGDVTIDAPTFEQH